METRLLASAIIFMGVGLAGLGLSAAADVVSGTAQTVVMVVAAAFMLLGISLLGYVVAAKS